jgi:tripeptidyl-peptidase-1
VLLKVWNYRLGQDDRVFTTLILSVSPNSTVFDPESACEQFIFSGGGFSNYFSVPDYQKDVVQNYLTNYPPPYPKTTYNSTGMSRAYPDLSANGANYVVVVSLGHRCTFPQILIHQTGSR